MIPSVKTPIKLGLIYLFCCLSFNNYASFLDDQLKYSRVRAAYKTKQPIIKEKLSDMELSLKNVNVLIKAYKYEKEVHIYVKSSKEKKWRLYEMFPFCSSSGYLGPKRQEGDFQIPEGFYHVNHFNPYSNFHLSLGVSYPNKADKIKSPHRKKGGAIYMHGNCVTIGCIPIQDEPIKEVYILGVLAKNSGQRKVYIDILPFKYSETKMKAAVQQMPENAGFWKNLYEVERNFDSTMVRPSIRVTDEGDYYIPA